MTNESVWPNGLSEEIAVIDVNIPALEELYGREFYRDLDDLDYFRYLVFRFGDSFYALKRYERAPLPGVTLVIEKYEEQDVEQILAKALRELRLTGRRILWRRH